MRNNIVISKMLGMINTISKYCEGTDYRSFSEN